MLCQDSCHCLYYCVDLSFNGHESSKDYYFFPFLFGWLVCCVVAFCQITASFLAQISLIAEDTAIGINYYSARHPWPLNKVLGSLFPV